MSEIIPVISATGLFTPPESVSNAELVESFNAYVDLFNTRNAAAIAAGDVAELAPSSVEFIEKASGIKSRHVMAKAPLLDPEIMTPRWPERSNDELSVLAEMGVKAAREALAAAGRDPKDASLKASFEEAAELADADPLHKAGVRTYTLQKWRINEGSITITVNYSDQSARIV